MSSWTVLPSIFRSDERRRRLYWARPLLRADCGSPSSSIRGTKHARCSKIEGSRSSTPNRVAHQPYLIRTRLTTYPKTTGTRRNHRQTPLPSGSAAGRPPLQRPDQELHRDVTAPRSHDHARSDLLGALGHADQHAEGCLAFSQEDTTPNWSLPVEMQLRCLEPFSHRHSLT